MLKINTDPEVAKTFDALVSRIPLFSKKAIRIVEDWMRLDYTITYSGNLRTSSFAKIEFCDTHLKIRNLIATTICVLEYADPKCNPREIANLLDTAIETSCRQM